MSAVEIESIRGGQKCHLVPFCHPDLQTTAASHSQTLFKKKKKKVKNGTLVWSCGSEAIPYLLEKKKKSCAKYISVNFNNIFLHNCLIQKSLDAWKNVNNGLHH